jgi:hypothetical protein
MIGSKPRNLETLTKEHMMENTTPSGWVTGPTDEERAADYEQMRNARLGDIGGIAWTEPHSHPTNADTSVSALATNITTLTAAQQIRLEVLRVITVETDGWTPDALVEIVLLVASAIETGKREVETAEDTAEEIENPKA